MTLQEILNQPDIQAELDKHMRGNWDGIPKNFKPILNLKMPHALTNRTQIDIKGVNNYSEEVITLKELNFLYLYCFVLDFNLFYSYERASEDQRVFYSFPDELKIFMRYSRQVDIDELQSYVRAYVNELENYVKYTGRIQLYSILD